MRPQLLILPIAAIGIFAAVEYRLTQEQPGSTDHTSGTAVSQQQLVLAPTFEARDAQLNFFRLDRFLGRHAVFVVFFDRTAGAGGSEILQHLKSHDDALRRTGTRVLGVSCALPQENRKWEFPESFDLVTDLEEQWEIHRQWGLFNESTRETKPAVFYIDRAGRVAMQAGLPLPLENPDQQIDVLLEIEHN
jgi:peroxiredoxin